MSGSMKTSIIVNMAGNLERKSARYARAVKKMANSSRKDMAVMQRSAAAVGRGLDKMGNRYTAGGAIAGLTMAGKQVVNLQRRFTRLGIQSNKSVEIMDSLKRDIFDIASAPEISIDPSELTAGVEKIVGKVGDLDLAGDNLRNMGLLISATGAAGENAGALVADFYEKFQIRTPQEFLKVLDMMTNQGKTGSFTLQDIATQGERVTSAYAQLGRVGPGAIKEMGAMLQMIRKGTGGPEQAATALQAYVRTLNDANKRKLLSKTGVKLIDPDNPKQMRSLVDITRDLIRVTGGDTARLSKFFDGEAMMALTAAAIEFKHTGSIASLERYMNVQSDGSAILRDSARAANDAAGAMQNLYTAWQQFADAKLTGPIKSVAATLKEVGSNNVIEAIGNVALAGGAAILGRKAYKGAKGGAGKLVKYGGSAAARRTIGGAMARLGARGLGALSPVGGVAAVGITAYEIGSAVEKALIGGSWGSWVYDVTHSKVEVDLKINQDGRVRVASVESNGIAGDVNIDTGPMTVGSQ